MEVRFNQWTDLGQITVTPNDDEVVVGSFSLTGNDNTLWVQMTCLDAPGPWPWSYAILGFKTSLGYELGSIKAYSEDEGEVFRLGNGLQPVERNGVITLRPRSFNLAWINKGNPWTLAFKAQSGVTGGGGDDPSFDHGTLATFADSRDDSPLDLFRVVFANPVSRRSE